jgi:hypothetical protein
MKKIIFFIVNVICGALAVFPSNAIGDLILTSKETRIATICLSEQIYWGNSNPLTWQLANTFSSTNRIIKFDVKKTLYDDNSIRFGFSHEEREKNTSEIIEPINEIEFSFHIDTNGKPVESMLYNGGAWINLYPESKVRKQESGAVGLQVPANYRHVFLSEWQALKTNVAFISKIQKNCQEYADRCDFYTHHGSEGGSGVFSSGIWWIGPSTPYSWDSHILFIQNDGETYILKASHACENIMGMRADNPRFELPYCIHNVTVMDEKNFENDDEYNFAVTSPLGVEYCIGKQAQKLLRSNDAEARDILENYMRSRNHWQKIYFNFFYDGVMIRTLSGDKSRLQNGK